MNNNIEFDSLTASFPGRRESSKKHHCCHWIPAFPGMTHMKKPHFLLLIIILLFSHLAMAATQEVYHFNTESQENEFNSLIRDLRCLVCPHHDLNESHAPFAENLKKRIYQWVSEGKSQKEIIDILTSKYGDRILFDPPVKKSTYILWIAPFLIFALMIVALLVFIKKRNML